MINICKTKPEDLDAVLKMERYHENRDFICPDSKKRHLDVINREDEFHFLIKDQKSDTVGFLILAITIKEHDSMELRRLVVDKKGEGIGTAALNWVKKFCFEDQGCHRLWLDVFVDNPIAYHLYLKVGFQLEGTKHECMVTRGQRRSLHLLSIINHTLN